MTTEQLTILRGYVDPVDDDVRIIVEAIIAELAEVRKLFGVHSTAFSEHYGMLLELFGYNKKSGIAWPGYRCQAQDVWEDWKAWHKRIEER